MQMEQRRRLTDLYSRGEEAEISGAEGDEPVKVWVKKMTPADAELAYLKASAKRASVLAMGKEEEPSDAYISLKGELDQFTQESLVVWCLATEMQDRRPQVETRVAFEEEWAENNYLLSLQERFSQPDFQAKMEETPDDEEVKRVLDEIGRYHTQVTEETAIVEKEVQAELESEGETVLRERVLKSMLDSQGDAAWLAEFHRCQVWRCVFDNDRRSERIFERRIDVDDLQVEVLTQLSAVIDRVHVSDKEGKD